MNSARFGTAGLLGCLLLNSSLLTRAQNSFSDDIYANSSSAAPKGDASKSVTMPISPAEQKTPAREQVDARFAKVAVVEAQDFKVPAMDELHGDPMHAETPNRLPGGSVITTEVLHGLYQGEPGSFLIFDVLGGQQGLPNAENALPAGRGGAFSDSIQREFGNYLGQVTDGKKDVLLVFYCQSVYCWMSYNAALRAVHLGYTRVHWYRGGIEAWQAAGLETQARQSPR